MLFDYQFSTIIRTYSFSFCATWFTNIAWFTGDVGIHLAIWYTDYNIPNWLRQIARQNSWHNRNLWCHFLAEYSAADVTLYDVSSSGSLWQVEVAYCACVMDYYCRIFCSETGLRISESEPEQQESGDFPSAKAVGTKLGPWVRTGIIPRSGAVQKFSLSVSLFQIKIIEK